MAATHAKSRVLCVMQLPPPVHGVTTVNERVAHSKLLTSRFELDVLPLRFASSIDDTGRISTRKVSRAVVTGARLAWRLLVRRPDAVYFTLTPRGPAFYRDCVYIGIMKSFGVVRVFHLHAQGVAEQLDARWKRELYAWAFRDAWVIHLSPALEHDTAEVTGSDRVVFVPNGVPDRSNGVATTPRATPRVLYLSNMIAEKGALILLEALGGLARRGVAFEATFAGARFNDGCVEQLEARIAELALSDRVRYIGPVYGAAKDALFRDHDVFAFPTSRDAFPLVLLEAMQHALPIVTTHQGAISEIVRDGVTGFVVPSRDPDALAAKLEVLLADPQLRQHMGERARSRYLESYTLERFEHSLATALAHCIGD